MKILFASSEVSPFSKTGGLGDVAYALPVALAKRGHDVVVLSPLYGCVDRRRHGLEPVAHDPMDFRLWLAPEKENMRFAFVEAQLFDREGVYGGYEGDYADNAARFAFFSRRLLRAAQALGFSPQILHLNDWQTAPGTLLGRPEGPRTVLTIHNLGYQGHFPLEEARHLFDDGLVPAAWTHWGKLALLRGGICTADLVTTVSPTYAREIRDTELSFGLGEELRALGDRLVGILNGIDVEAWNPATDPHLPAHFSADDRRGKAACKRALQEELGLEPSNAFLVGMVTRIAGQKGLDLLLTALDTLLASDLQFAILGSGDPALEEELRRAVGRWPGRFALRLGFDESLARRIYGGSDAFLMPSLYEPCGLSQLYALRYGSLPIVRATGGLCDTVQDGRTGFFFEAYRPEAMVEAIRRAEETWRNRQGWEEMVDRAMREDFSWDASARAYEEAYARLVPDPADPGKNRRDASR